MGLTCIMYRIYIRVNPNVESSTLCKSPSWQPVFLVKKKPFLGERTIWITICVIYFLLFVFLRLLYFHSLYLKFIRSIQTFSGTWHTNARDKIIQLWKFVTLAYELHFQWLLYILVDLFILYNVPFGRFG